MSNPNQILYEEALWELFAGWTGRTKMKTIYVGALPEKQLESTAIMLDSEILGEDTDGLRKYFGRYIGKCEERDTCIVEIDKVKQNLIKYSQEINFTNQDGAQTVNLHQVRQRGGEALYETKDDGEECWNFVINLILEFNPA